jgi:hypothetical protein
MNVSLNYLQYGVDHVKSHFDTVPRVVVTGLGEARDTIVAVAEDLDAQAVVVLNK